MGIFLLKGRHQKPRFVLDLLNFYSRLYPWQKKTCGNICCTFFPTIEDAHLTHWCFPQGLVKLFFLEKQTKDEKSSLICKIFKLHWLFVHGICFVFFTPRWVPLNFQTTHKTWPQKKRPVGIFKSSSFMWLMLWVLKVLCVAFWVLYSLHIGILSYPWWWWWMFLGAGDVLSEEYLGGKGFDMIWWWFAGKVVYWYTGFLFFFFFWGGFLGVCFVRFFLE